MVRNGLRIIELQRANIGDLETRQGRKILRVRGKGRDEKDEFTILAEPSEGALLDYLSLRKRSRDDEPLFVGVGGRNRGGRLTRWTIRQRVTKYLIAAGVKRGRVTPHSLRHSFITLAIEGGATIEEAQIAARHRSIETTRRYFHEHDRLERPVEDLIEI
jgi:integrase/recombinase XerD